MERTDKKRFYPEGWRIIPRALFEFCAPAWGQKSNKPNRGYNFDFNTGKKVTSSECKVQALSTVLIDASKSSKKEAQVALSPFDLRVLSELLYLKEQDRNLLDSIVDNQIKPQLFCFKPAELCHALGMSLSGSAYDRIESSLKAIALFFLEIEHQNQNARFNANDPLYSFRSHHLFSTVDTGRIKVVHGQEIEGSECRNLFWRVKFGAFLNHIAKKKAAWFSYPKIVLSEAGRSSIAQWLVLFSFSAPHTGSITNEYRLSTLVKKANINSQIADRIEKLISATTRKKQLDSVDKDAITRRLRIRVANRAADSIRKAFERLQNSNIMLRAMLCVASSSAMSKVRIHRHETDHEALIANVSPELRLNKPPS